MLRLKIKLMIEVIDMLYALLRPFTQKSFKIEDCMQRRHSYIYIAKYST